MSVSVWTSVPPFPTIAVREATQAEADGYDGVVVPDSQSLCADVYVEMALIARDTERISFGPGVSNPVTRHPAVTASAMASLQAESGGRAVLGIGRGDSALAHIGYAPAPLKHFSAYLQAVKGYLAGEEVPFDARFAAPDIRPVADLGLGNAPEGGAIRWMRPSLPRVPIEVAATGPKVIALAAVHADSIALCVGSDPERVAWAIDTARQARVDAGLDPDSLVFSSYTNMVVHDDLAKARELIGGGLASFSRFSVMHGTVTGGASQASSDVLTSLHQNYDMMDHGRSSASHVEQLPAEFVEENGIIGSADACLSRLRALHELGVTKFIVMSLMSRDEQAAVHTEAMRDVVIPELKRW